MAKKTNGNGNGNGNARTNRTKRKVTNRNNGNGNNNGNGKKEYVNFEKKAMTIIENGQEKNIPLNNKQIAELLYGSKLQVRGKNKKQKDLLVSIGTKEITIAVGPAGVGKSYISVAKALELLAHSENNYQKIYIVTPNVELDGSQLGYMPGNLDEKLGYYLFSTYYLMDKVIGKQNRKRLIELGIIEPLAIGFLRGVNIDNSILICEEAQNTTSLQMKTLITRIGFNSKFIISGDLEQTDIKNQNGLQDALAKFSTFEEIGIINFEHCDVVRNPIITKILSKY